MNVMLLTLTTDTQTWKKLGCHHSQIPYFPDDKLSAREEGSELLKTAH